MKLTEEKAAQVAAAKETLDYASEVLGSVLERKIPKVKAAKELGISSPSLENNLEQSFCPFIRHLKILSKEEVAELIREMQTPQEKLVADILGIRDAVRNGQILILGCENEEILGRIMDEALTPREKAVLESYYGFDGKRRTLDDTAREFGVTRERIRQIAAKACRKLRLTKYLHQLLPEYAGYLKALEDMNELEGRNAKYAAEKTAILQKYDDMVQKHIIMDEKAEVVKEHMEDLQKFLCTPLVEMEGFPDIWVAALAQENCVTVSDLQNIKFQALSDTAWKYRYWLSLYELFAVCSTLGIRVAAGNNPSQSNTSPIYALPLSELNLSVRTRNCFARRGCLTVGDVVSLTKEQAKKTRNLGKRSMEEIESVLDSMGLSFAEPEE